ncbi:protein transporter Sec31 [Streptomyces phytophilus]|uniref:protein transporter Sec31 n=1 Tax=Streptomyces phytophilus TaxID=722715 RepID=UPI0015F010FF|nr:protein transporter Sec31 [Streptomyces phytophilus]
MKTRPDTRTRQVPHTIDGITHHVTETYTVHVPVPPRDWDRAVLTAVTAGAALAVAVSVVWSTAAIGDLLARTVPAGPAYAAAVAFDAAWILCMGVEWLSRYDPDRARLPRWAGHAALLIAMAAVAAHGWLDASPAVGLVGAAVSALAKGAWTVVLAHQAPPLDDRTRQWAQQELAVAGAELGLLPVRRRVARARGLLAAEAAALPAPETNPDPHPDVSADPDGDPDTVRAIRPSIREAVRTAYDSGITDPDRVRGYVQKLLPDARPDTVDRYIRERRGSA